MKTTPVQAANGPTLTEVPEPTESRSDSRLTADLPRLSGNRCRCAACKRTFVGLTAFDTHRFFVHDDVRGCHDDQWLAEHNIIRRENGVYGSPPMTEQEKRERGWA